MSQVGVLTSAGLVPIASSTRCRRGVMPAPGTSPAIIKTPTWDIVAWNQAARVVMTDYEALAPRERNTLRAMFINPHMRAKQFDWEAVARFVVATFRADASKAGAAADMQAMVDELSRISPEFVAMWRDNDVRDFGAGVKRLRHALLGDIELEYSAFAVDGRPDLTMLVYHPLGADDAKRIAALMKEKAGGKSAAERPRAERKRKPPVRHAAPRVATRTRRRTPA